MTSSESVTCRKIGMQSSPPFRDGPTGGKQNDSASNKRAILSPLSVNGQHRPNTVAHYSDRMPFNLLRKSIPKPALIPDVFEAPRDDASTPKNGAASSSVLPSKRARGSNGLSLPKRTKVEKEAVDNSTGRHRAEEEKWRAKWVKVFPTLVFHFEIGSDHGPRRALMARITEMGAVSGRSSSVAMTTTYLAAESRPILVESGHACRSEESSVALESQEPSRKVTQGNRHSQVPKEPLPRRHRCH